MPELPEVETIKQGLQKYIVGKKVESIEVRLPKIVLSGNPQDLVGATAVGTRRFGKVLALDFDNDLTLLAHVKLTGQFVYVGPDRPKDVQISQRMVGALPGKFTHLIVSFEGGGKLFYNDIRQFGWIRIIPTQEVEKFKFIQELGPEPLVVHGAQAISAQEEKERLTLEKFQKILQTRNTKIKQLLLDQTLISGMGNIYANDALFLAGVDPARSAKSLTDKEAETLYNRLLEVLKLGLKYGGSSEYTYVNLLGQEGEYQKHFLVYGQLGKPCRNCGTPIKKIYLGGRGTYFCQVCQK